MDFFTLFGILPLFGIIRDYKILRGTSAEGFETNFTRVLHKFTFLKRPELRSLKKLQYRTLPVYPTPRRNVLSRRGSYLF